MNNIDCFLYSLNETIFEKCFVDIIHSVVVADIALRWYTKIIIFKKRLFIFHNALFIGIGGGRAGFHLPFTFLPWLLQLV